MRIPNWLRVKLVKHAERTQASRPCDFIIGDPHNPYILRWWEVPRNRIANVYNHAVLRSDDDRANHDHPWLFNLSIILEGRYFQHTIRKGGVHVRKEYTAGDIIFRWGPAPHRLEVAHGEFCKTLFLTGPIVREWGFHCPQGWRRWQDFTSPADRGQVGRGCD